MTVTVDDEVEVAVRELLLADPDFAALAGTRLYPVVLPQGVTFPAATYQGITAELAASHSGSSGHERARIQIDAYGKTWGDSRRLQRAAAKRLHGFRGLAPGGRLIQSSFAFRGPDEYEDEQNGDGTRGRFRTSADYSVAHGGVS